MEMKNNEVIHLKKKEERKRKKEKKKKKEKETTQPWKEIEKWLVLEEAGGTGRTLAEREVQPRGILASKSQSTSEL